MRLAVTDDDVGFVVIWGQAVVKVEGTPECRLCSAEIQPVVPVMPQNEFGEAATENTDAVEDNQRLAIGKGRYARIRTIAMGFPSVWCEFIC